MLKRRMLRIWRPTERPTNKKDKLFDSDDDNSRSNSDRQTRVVISSDEDTQEQLLLISLYMTDFSQNFS